MGDNLSTKKLENSFGHSSCRSWSAWKALHVVAVLIRCFGKDVVMSGVELEFVVRHKRFKNRFISLIEQKVGSYIRPHSVPHDPQQWLRCHCYQGLLQSCRAELLLNQKYPDLSKEADLVLFLTFLSNLRVRPLSSSLIHGLPKSSLRFALKLSRLTNSS